MSASRRPPAAIDNDRGADSSRPLSWAFETPGQHWAEHDARQIAYWLARSPDERLGQAAEYRWRRHGDIPAPVVWSWRFLPPDEH